MTAKYDFPRLHADCLSWCQNPSFPYRWQGVLEVYKEYSSYVIRTFGKSGSVHSRIPIQPHDCFPKGREGDYFLFAFLIGLSIEDYRIKETFKSAVERYLESLAHLQSVWPKGPWVIQRNNRSICLVASPNCNFIHQLWHDEWEATDRRYKDSYYLLRLDLNPDYQVD